MYLATEEIIKKIDKAAAEMPGMTARRLMENAGCSAAASASADIRSRAGRHTPRVLVIAGKGKNGGDGAVMAREFLRAGFDVRLTLPLGEIRDADGACFLAEYEKAGGKTVGAKKAAEFLDGCHAVADAVFGVGFSGALPDDVRSLFAAVRGSGALRLAVDCPSGLSADTGRAAEGCLPADITLAVCMAKRGMYAYPGREYCGEIRICGIGADPVLCLGENAFTDILTDDAFVRQRMPARRENSSKGDFGRVLAVCGSGLMSGAAVLAAAGALRMGAGLFELCAEEAVIRAAQAQLPEPVYTKIPPVSEWAEKDTDYICTRAEKAAAVLVGCGLSASPNAVLLAEKLLAAKGCPVIFDADALNSLAACGSTEKILSSAKRQVIITPHPLEFARLCKMTVPEVQENRLESASGYAKKTGAVVLLKGAGTIVAAPDGRIFINNSGSSALAKGGSGDVLAGMLSALIAQKTDAAAAALAAYLHGRAGEMLARRYSEYGVLPSELAAAAAEVLCGITRA